MMLKKDELLLLDVKTAGVINSFMPDSNKITDLVKFYSVFSKESRLKILTALSISKMCVSDISRMLEMNQTTVSHELRVLKDFRLVKCKRQGKIIFYEVSNGVVDRLFLNGIEYLGY
ncbi:MAG: helix-turn-helix transcriptional regulator [Clostridia bacterium]|nr:helix-turn-helix transcriptional regulator [Clostridia bacterium]MBR2496096.1 helix-turn-helix transcriptional regulator [Clostridia bacterium]